MGLTVHYQLAAPKNCDAAQAFEFVRAMRRRAQGFKQRSRVDKVQPIGNDHDTLRWATDYRTVPHPYHAGTWSGIEIPAEEGFLFWVEVGRDCEPLLLGLCRYPKTVLLGGKRYRTERPGWRLGRFSKTQYASLHGWEHFRRCHGAVVDLLRSLRQPGLEITIHDEGDYWPGRSLEALRRNLDEMNGIVAAAAGAFKDLDEASNGLSNVVSPIFAHPQFEQLEAEGEMKHGMAIRRAHREVSRC